MDSNMSPGDVKAKRLKVLGPTLGPLYDALYDEVTWLHAKWLEYLKLYAHSQDRIDLLNSQAAYFFQIVQEVLWNDLLLQMAHLTGPLESKGKPNLTLRALRQNIPDPQLASRVAVLVDEAVAFCDFATQWRNKRLAHLDLDLALHHPAAVLPPVSKKKVEDALLSISRVMNAVEEQFFNYPVAFELVICPRDAEDLVYHLRVAARAEELQLTSLGAGSLLPEDFEPLPYG